MRRGSAIRGAVDMGAVVDSAVIDGTDPAVVVSAQELRAWTDAEVEAATFRCCGCTVEMYPKAHRPDRRVQAHFATKPLRQHVNCTLVEDTAAAGGVIAGGPPGRLPVLRPTRLVESEDRKISGEPAASLSPSTDRRRTSLVPVSATGDVRRRTSGSAIARSIRPFAAAFLEMSAEERRGSPIELPGVNADRYQFAFKGLPRRDIVRLPHRRVLHAQLRWTGQISDVDGIYRVELYAGEGYDPDSRRFTRPWTLVVDHRDWTSGQRNHFRDEFASVSGAARDHGLTPWAFALADQNPAELTELTLTRRAYVAFLPGQ